VSQLLRYDAVTFLTLLEGVRLSEAGSSIWLLHEATHIMYEQVCWLRKCVKGDGKQRAQAPGVAFQEQIW
jgi:hypothetical protein